MIVLVNGDIFTTKCQTIVNPVNTQGIMESGLAYEVRKKYPACVFGYASACERRVLEPGKLLLWKGDEHWILHFPIKIAWYQPARVPYIEHGLQKFVKCYKEKGIRSVAFPLLGCGKDGLNRNEATLLLNDYLNPLDIRCEIYVPKGYKKKVLRT